MKLKLMPASAEMIKLVALMLFVDIPLAEEPAVADSLHDRADEVVSEANRFRRSTDNLP